MPSIQPSLIDRLRAWPTCRHALRRPEAWGGHVLLSAFATSADAAVAARTDPLVLEALASQVDDEEAALAAMSVLAAGLGRVVGQWRRAGLTGVELQDAEAHLVLEALASLHTTPGRPAEVIVQQAWHRVSARRRTEIARRARSLPMGRVDPPDLGQLSTAAQTISLAVASGISDSERRTVVAAITGPTRADAQAASGAERTRRWRARRALRAALLEESPECTRKVAV